MSVKSDKFIKWEDDRMDEAKKQKLVDAGINYDEGLNRFMQKEETYLKFLRRIGEDGNMSVLRKKIEENDVEGAFAAAHTIKGVCANLSIDGMNAVLNPMVEILRAGSMENVEDMMEEVERVYGRVTEAISEI